MVDGTIHITRVTSDKYNDRPIVLVTASFLCLKFFKCTLLHMITNLDLSQNTLLTCEFLQYKIIIKYYTRANTPVYTCFLEARKAFDRVNNLTLFTQLIDSAIPLLIVRICVFWYKMQHLCVIGGWPTSSSFTISNGDVFYLPRYLPCTCMD